MCRLKRYPSVNHTGILLARRMFAQANDVISCLCWADRW